MLPQPRRFSPSSPQRGAPDHPLPKSSSPCLPCPTLSVPFPCFTFFYLHLSSVPPHEGWGLSPPGSLCTATPRIVPALKNKPILTALAQPGRRPSFDAPPLENPSLVFFSHSDGNTSTCTDSGGPAPTPYTRPHVTRLLHSLSSPDVTTGQKHSLASRAQTPRQAWSSFPSQN